MGGRPMNIQHLEYFVQIVDTGNISKVANQTHITQSALTQILKKMETDLQCTLLLRSNKGVEITEMGKVVYDYAKQLIQTYDALLGRLTCIIGDSFNITVKLCCSLNNNLFPTILSYIRNQYSNVHIHIFYEDKQKIISEIKSGTCDFGLIMCPMDIESELSTIVIGQEKIVLVAGNEFPIPDHIDFIDVTKHKLIDFSLGSYTKVINSRISHMPYLEKDIKLFQPFLSISSMAAVQSLVESNFGIAFLPYECVKSDIEKGKYRIVTLENFNLEFTIKLISRPDELLIPMIKNIKQIFIESAHQYFAENK